MNRDHRTRLALVPLLLPLLVAGRCNKQGLPAEIETFSANVSLINGSDRDSVHILVPGENFAPANKLAPGGSRTVRMTLEHLKSYEFRAGQNGQVRATHTCTVEEDAESSDPFHVVGLQGALGGWGLLCDRGFI